MTANGTKTAMGLEEFKSTLKKHSMKATPQRLAVHSAMMELGHASADQVSDWIQKKGSTHTTVASVYNVLTQLALLGVYSHRLSANNKMYFDVNTFKHIHLYDCINHEFKDVMDEELIDIVESKLKGKRYKGYKVENIDIQILCRPSAKKNVVRK